MGMLRAGALLTIAAMPDLLRDPDRLGVSVLPDGRGLGWAEWGPEAGLPVLLCSGAATGRSLGCDGDVVDELGVRLIAVDRPGLGASDPLPGRTLTDWAADVRAFVTARGLSRPAIVGSSQGAPFALVCAAAGLVRGVAVVSGTDELADPRFAAALVPDVRRMVAESAADPEGVEAFLRGWGSPDAMWRLIVDMSGAADLAVYGSPAFASAYRRALAEAFSQGAHGYARDTVLAMRRWPFDPGTIRVPVDLWYGALDTSTVHSPDLGASLAARLPTAVRRVLPDAGGALLWTHTAEVLRSLVQRAFTA